MTSLWCHYLWCFKKHVNKTQAFLASLFSSKKGSVLKMVHTKRKTSVWRFQKPIANQFYLFSSTSNHVLKLADFFPFWIAFVSNITEPKSWEVYIVRPFATTGLKDNLIHCSVGGFKHFWNEIMASIWRYYDTIKCGVFNVLTKAECF